MADYVGRWDCPSCGKVVWGILRHCPDCGSPCTGEYYLPVGEPSTTAEEVRRIIQAGPSWQCSHCHSTNYGDTGYCVDCGAKKGTSSSYKVIDYGTEDVPRSGDAVQETPPTSRVAMPPAYAATLGDNNWKDAANYGEGQTATRDYARFKKPALISLVVVGLAVIAAITAFMLMPFEVGAKADQFDWSRTIFVDQYQTVREGDWSVPSRGRLVSTESRIHHYNTVLDHYETRSRDVPSGSETYNCGTISNGNGTFSDRTCTRTTYRTETYQEPVYRQDPVYASWYNYDIDEWVSDRTVVTAGVNRTSPTPHWGELILRCDRQEVLGCERENSRKERYIVIFTWKQGDETKTYELEEVREDWDSYDQGKTYVLRLNRLGLVLNDPLRPEEK